MIDPNAIAGIAHEQYKRWDSAKDTLTVPHLMKRGQDRELQKAKAYAKNVSVKAASAPAGKTPIKGGHGFDKRVAGSQGSWTRDSQFKRKTGGDAFAHGAWSSSNKGNNQPDLSRSGPAHFGSGQFSKGHDWSGKPDYSKAPRGMSHYSFPKPSAPTSLPSQSAFNSRNKGFGQPDLHRNAPGAFSAGATSHAVTHVSHPFDHDQTRPPAGSNTPNAFNSIHPANVRPKGKNPYGGGHGNRAF